MGSKLKFVLSDLHLGAGYSDKGGNPLEDFTADEHLVHFLQEITRESDRDRREIELIVNGDFLEFLQVPAVDNFEPAAIYPHDAYLDSSQEASVKRLDIMVAGHRVVFDALATFMQPQTPRRRITIIKGNQDVNLYWPMVKSRLRDVLAASGPRSSLLLFAAEFICREKIYVEHGHQRTEQVNRFHDFHDPRLPGDPLQLGYPPGSHLFIDLLNQVERDRWFVDKVKPLTALIWFALRWDFDFAVTLLSRLIRHMAESSVNNSIRQESTWSDIQDVLSRLELPDECRRLSQRYADDAVFREQFHRQIWPYLGTSTGTTLDAAAVQSDPIALGRTVQLQQRAILQQAAEEIVQQEKVDIILFGHTHHPVYQRLETGGAYVNTGCWSWKDGLSDAQPELIELLFRDSLKFDELPGRLPYARIDYDEADHPTAKLLDFANNNAALQDEPDKTDSFFTRLLNRFTSA